jgi:hypothetical protein
MKKYLQYVKGLIQKSLIKFYFEFKFICIQVYSSLRNLIIKNLIIQDKIKTLSKKNDVVHQYIVTLTSYGHRITSTLPYTLYSLFNQTVLPDHIILWLTKTDVIPSMVQLFIHHGLEIRYCSDIKSYKKLVPALSQFPNDILITADDDIYYHKNWFKIIKNSYLKKKDKIHCWRAHEIRIGKDNKILPYKNWNHCVKKFVNSKRIFPTGGSGVLYPPNTLDIICTNCSEFMELAPKADDIWFWAMSTLKGTEYCIVKNSNHTISLIDPREEKKGLGISNVINNENDRQLSNIIARFPQLLDKIL